MSDELAPLVTIDPEIMGGEPVFRGTRVPVQTLVDFLVAGDTVDYFLNQFPSVRREQAVGFIARSAVAFAELNAAPAA